MGSSNTCKIVMVKGKPRIHCFDSRGKLKMNLSKDPKGLEKAMKFLEKGGK